MAHSSHGDCEDGPFVGDEILDGLRDGEVVVFGGWVPELVLDAGPDGVAGLLGEFEEATGLVCDGLEVADEGGAVGVVL